MTPQEQLILDYNIQIDICNDPSEFDAYFRDCGFEYFQCGQGYYEDQATVIVQLGNEFYKVVINAIIGSQKVEFGDRLYWIEDIDTVEWEQISAPALKHVTQYAIVATATLTDVDYNELLNYFNVKNISYTIDKILV